MLGCLVVGGGAGEGSGGQERVCLAAVSSHIFTPSHHIQPNSFKLLDAEDGGSGGLSPRRRTNLAKTLGHLILHGWLSLSMLKVVDVSALGVGGVAFFRTLWLALLGAGEEEEEGEEDGEGDREREEQLLAAVQRVGQSKEPLALAELLTAFVQRLILGGDNGGQSEGSVVERRRARKRGKALVRLLDKLATTRFIAAGSAPTPHYD